MIEKDMNKYKELCLCCGKSLAFLAVLVLLLTGCSFLLRPKANDDMSGIRGLENYDKVSCFTGEPEGTIDVIALGDSLVYSAVNPLQMYGDYGWTGFDLATGSQRLYDTAAYLDKAIKLQQSKVVLLDTNCIFRRCTPEQSFYNLVSEAIPAVKYHDRWKVLKKEELSLTVSNEGRAQFKGYYFDTRIQSAEMKNDKEEDTMALRAIPFMNRFYIRQMAEACSREDITLILITIPSEKDWNIKKHNSCRKLAEELALPYYDLNEEGQMEGSLAIDWQQDTRDGGEHVNSEGAWKITTRIEQILLECADNLIDHRGEAGFSGWDEDFAAFQKKVE